MVKMLCNGMNEESRLIENMKLFQMRKLDSII